MTRNVSAHDFSEIYDDLDIDLTKLGCVMLDLDSIPVTELVPGRGHTLHFSEDPARSWIRGAVGESKSHITMLYGLLSTEWQPHIRNVLDGWTLPEFVELDGIEVFESPYDDEKYSCIVARIRITPDLQEGHARLELLPHINTFLDWRAHVTLAYVTPESRDAWVASLEANLPRTLKVIGMDIGDQHD